jgi:hypothetical protein
MRTRQRTPTNQVKNTTIQQFTERNRKLEVQVKIYWKNVWRKAKSFGNRKLNGEKQKRIQPAEAQMKSLLQMNTTVVLIP